MRAKELMIGDWVMVNDVEHTHPLQVAEILRKSGTYNATLYWDGMPDNVNPETLTADVDKVLPIPLTPEILKKNGFVEKEFYSELILGDFRILCDLHYVCVYHNEHVDLDIPIEYLHELQHALKLCRIEKEIVL